MDAPLGRRGVWKSRCRPPTPAMMNKVSPAPALPAGFAADAGWFPFSLDLATDALTLVRCDEKALRAASFLDERSLVSQAERHVVQWHDAAAALDPGAQRDAQYIFHIGHVGS